MTMIDEQFALDTMEIIPIEVKSGEYLKVG
jgi:hypothetical protein